MSDVTSPLYNTTTREPETLPFDQIQSAILNGTHSYAADAKVPVVDDSGKAYELPATQLKDALGQGYKLESPHASSVRQYVDENKGLAGTAKVALGKFVDEAALGIPQVIAQHMDPFDAANKWEPLKKDHGIATAVGSTAGFVASMLFGGPLFEGAAKAGQVAERVAASQLERAGLKVGAESAAKSITAKMATSAAKLGAEGVVVSAPRALTEAGLGDTDAAAESLMAGGVMGGVLGLGVGAISGPASRVMKSLSKTMAAESPAAQEIIRAAENAAPGEQGLVGAASHMGASDETIEGMLNNLKRQKANAPEIELASKQLGVPVLEGQTSDSKFVQDMHSSIINSPSPVGIAQAEKLGTIQGGVREGLEKALSDGSGVSAESAGDHIRQVVQDKLDAKADEFAEKYQNVLGKEARQIEVSAEDAANKAKGIIPQDTLKFAPASTKAALQEIKERFSLIENAHDIKILRTQIGQEASGAYRSGNFPLYGILQNAKEKLTALEEEAVFNAAKASGATKKEGEALAQSLIDQMHSTKKEYAQFKEMISDFAKDAKLGKVGHASHLGDKLEDVSGSKLVDKLFDKKNPKALDRLREQFPDAYETLMKHKRSEYLQKGMKDGHINTAQVIKDIKSLGPEMQKHLLGEKSHWYDAARTVHESIMPNLNPSGTSKGMAFRELLTPKGAIGGAMDMAKMQAVKASRAQGLLEAEQAMKKTGLSLDKIPAAIENMKRIGSESNIVGAGLAHALELGGSTTTKTSKNDDIKKIKKKAEYFVGNPDALINQVAQHTSVFAHTGAPQTASAMGQKMAATIDYIHKITPKPLSPQNPFMPDHFTPSDAAMAAYERKLAVILNPASVIDDLGRGTLTHDQVEALSTVYPSIYKAMQGRVVNHLMTKKPNLPYQSRLKLSMLLGFNVDGSLEPSFVSSLQDNFQFPQEQMNPDTRLSFANQAQSESDTEELG